MAQVTNQLSGYRYYLLKDHITVSVETKVACIALPSLGYPTQGENNQNSPLVPVLPWKHGSEPLAPAVAAATAAAFLYR